VIRGRSRAGAPLALAALAAVALAGCGAASLPPPAASQAATAPAVTPMPAGTYTSLNFQPAVTFTVPEGWVVAQDAPLYLSLQPADNDLIGIHIFRDPKAASQDPTCPAAPEPGVGGTSSELSAWIRGRPGLTVSNPAMATIGGLPGVSLDLGLKSGWTAACPFANGSPSVPLFNSSAIDHWVVVGNERLRAYLVDLPGGGTVVVDLDAFEGDQIEGLISRSGGIVRSLKFAPVEASAAPAAASASAAPASVAPSAASAAPASTAP
jgi:hypothetical protein